MDNSFIVKSSFVADVYESMQGAFESDFLVPGVDHAFATGEKCEKLYALVYDAERRLEERLGVDPHDKDVESIINNMTEIQKELCYRMYYYGAKFGMRD